MQVTEVTSTTMPQCHTGNITQDQLQQELKTAKEQLEKSQAELQNARISLTGASSALAESKTSLQTLKQGIEKERRVHRRQIWQNRFWFLVAGAAIGVAAAK